MKSFYHTRSAALVAVLFFMSCNNAPVNNMHSASLGSSGKKATPQPTDLKFMYDVYALGIYKIQLAQEAQIRSTSPQTIAIAKRVVDAHSNINATIGEITSPFNLAFRADITEGQKRTWKSLVMQKGWLFDKAFATVITNEALHERQLLQNEGGALNDEKLKMIATKYAGFLEDQVQLINALIPVIEKRISALPPANKKIKK